MRVIGMGTFLKYLRAAGGVTSETNQITGLVGFVVNGASQPPSSPITTPVGFRGTTLATELDLRRTLAGVVSNFDITSKIPAVTKTYYVDPVNGVNANAGTSAGTAKKDLAVVLALADADQIIITGLTADFVGLGTQSWNNVQPSRSLSVVNPTGYRYISAACAALPTWAVNGTYSNVYSTVIGATSAAGVVDLLISTTQSYVNASGADVSLTGQPKRFRALVKVANLSAVAATAGTWFHDGTSLHVRPHDGRNLVGDTKMIPSNQSQNGRFPTGTNNITVYVQGIDFVGGNSAFYAYALSTVTGCVFAHNNCSFQGAALANGLSIGLFGKVYGYRSAAYDNYLDGFNYHSNESNGTTPDTSPDCVEIECVAAGNGTTGSAGGSDNASTSHDFCNVVRLNDVLIDSSDRVAVDTNSANSWNLGCYVGQAITVASNQESACALSTSKMWLDSCYVPAGSNARFLSAQTATMRLFNSGAAANNVTGEATGTLNSYYG